MTADCPYHFAMGRPFRPLKLPFCMWDLNPHLIHGSLLHPYHKLLVYDTPTCWGKMHAFLHCLHDFMKFDTYATALGPPEFSVRRAPRSGHPFLQAH